MAELMFSALARNIGGTILANTQMSAPATMSKLIHLKISVAAAAEPEPPSSAANDAAEKSRETPHTKSEEMMSLRGFIGPLGDSPGGARFGWQFRRPVERCSAQCRAGRQPLRRPRVPWRKRLQRRIWPGHLSRARRVHRAVVCGQLPARHKFWRGPCEAIPDIP